MLEFIIEHKIYLLAIASGVIPAIFWLWFWLREDSDEPEPIGLIIICFILGALLVFVAIYLQKYSLNYLPNNTTRIIIWASIEELLKFAGVGIIIYGNSHADRPIDFPMYFIATALGFAALENFLYLIDPFGLENTAVGMITGNLRFLGSTLLHAISSAMIGSAIGLAFFIKKYKILYIFIGVICAITLHSLFNFFIMKGSGANFLSVFSFLWVVTIINILIFEKLKRMGKNIPILNK